MMIEHAVKIMSIYDEKHAAKITTNVKNNKHAGKIMTNDENNDDK